MYLSLPKEYSTYVHYVNFKGNKAHITETYLGHLVKYFCSNVSLMSDKRQINFIRLHMNSAKYPVWSPLCSPYLGMYTFACHHLLSIQLLHAALD